MSEETQILTGNTIVPAEPILIDVNKTFNLLNPVHIPFFPNQPPASTVTIFKLIKRPVMHRIVLITQEFNRFIVYDGESDYNLHVNDTLEQYVQVLLNKVDQEYAHSN